MKFPANIALHPQPLWQLTEIAEIRQDGRVLVDTDDDECCGDDAAEMMDGDNDCGEDD